MVSFFAKQKERKKLEKEVNQFLDELQNLPTPPTPSYFNRPIEVCDRLVRDFNSSSWLLPGAKLHIQRAVAYQNGEINGVVPNDKKNVVLSDIDLAFSFLWAHIVGEGKYVKDNKAFVQAFHPFKSFVEGLIEYAPDNAFRSARNVARSPGSDPTFEIEFGELGKLHVEMYRRIFDYGDRILHFINTGEIRT